MKDKEKEIKHKMYLKSEEMRMIKKELRALRMELEQIRGINYAKRTEIKKTRTKNT